MALYLACDVEDYSTATGECSAPYYAPAPQFIPELTAQEGLEIGFAIVAVWTIGLIARVLVRLGQEAQKH